MTEERRRVLDMLSEGKVTVEEAERLLKALQGHPPRDPQETRNRCSAISDT